MKDESKRKDSVLISLPEAVSHILEECRMVLPGIQALFGFQLIVVFNPGFAGKLTPADQLIHLWAIGLAAVSVALVMTPAAYHRQIGPQEVSWRFIALATRLLLWSMFPLMVSICMEFFLIAKIILQGAVYSLLFSTVLLGIFLCLWFLLPRFPALSNLLLYRHDLFDTVEKSEKSDSE
jgi:hypothetical protein